MNKEDTYLVTDLLTYLLSYLLTYFLTYLLTYLPRVYVNGTPKLPSATFGVIIVINIIFRNISSITYTQNMGGRICVFSLTLVAFYYSFRFLNSKELIWGNAELVTLFKYVHAYTYTVNKFLLQNSYFSVSVLLIQPALNSLFKDPE